MYFLDPQTCNAISALYLSILTRRGFHSLKSCSRNALLKVTMTLTWGLSNNPAMAFLGTTVHDEVVVSSH